MAIRLRGVLGSRARSLTAVGVLPIDREKDRSFACPPLCLCHSMSMTAVATPPPPLLSLTRRPFHSTAAPQSASFAVACLGIAGACYTLDHGVKAFQEWQKQRAASGDADRGTEGGEKKDSSSASGGFSSFYAKRFYDGPFEDEMTRREAALILGVRESASATRIKNAHRKLLILNHPDTGGSTFIATKLNEAKELLLKTATDD